MIVGPDRTVSDSLVEVAAVAVVGAGAVVAALDVLPVVVAVVVEVDAFTLVSVVVVPSASISVVSTTGSKNQMRVAHLGHVVVVDRLVCVDVGGVAEVDFVVVVC